MATGNIASLPNARNVPSKIHFDSSYCKSLSGILKLIEAGASLSGFICIQTMYLAAYISAGGWYSFVSMTTFVFSLLFFAFYSFHIVERLQWFPWLIVETGFAALMSAFFFIAGCVTASNLSIDKGFAAASFFAFLAMLILAFEGLRKYRHWKSDNPAQGERITANAHISTPTGRSYPTY